MNRSFCGAALAAALMLSAGAAQAACDTAAAAEQCKGKLGDGFQVVNTYSLSADAGKPVSVADDHVLSSRMEYRVVICGDPATTFVLENGAREPVMNNGTSGALQQDIVLKVPKASVYYLVFQAPADSCGAAVLGLKR